MVMYNIFYNIYYYINMYNELFTAQRQFFLQVIMYLFKLQKKNTILINRLLNDKIERA